MFTFSSDKDQRKNSHSRSLSLSLNEPLFIVIRQRDTKVLVLFQVDHSIIQREMNGTLVLSKPHALWLGGINSTATRLKRDVQDVKSLRNFTGDIASKSALPIWQSHAGFSCYDIALVNSTTKCILNSSGSVYV